MKLFITIAALLLAGELFAQVKISANPSAGDELYTELPSDRRYFTSFDGTKICYEKSGQGKPVILIHGFISTMESWKKAALYEELEGMGFRVILIDLRGNGYSDKPHAAEAFEKDAEAKDVMALADKLKLQKYSVVGYSRGAIIASRVTLLDKRVDAAVLGGMGSDFTNPNWPRRHSIYKALSGERVPEFEGLVKRVKSDSTLDQTCLAYMQKSQPVSTKEELLTISKPVLVICGDKDEDNGSSKNLSLMIPGSTYVRVPGVHNDAARSQEFSAEVLKFLSKVGQ